MTLLWLLTLPTSTSLQAAWTMDSAMRPQWCIFEVLWGFIVESYLWSTGLISTRELLSAVTVSLQSQHLIEKPWLRVKPSREDRGGCWFPNPRPSCFPWTFPFLIFFSINQGMPILVYHYTHMPVNLSYKQCVKAGSESACICHFDKPFHVFETIPSCIPPTAIRLSSHPGLQKVLWKLWQPDFETWFFARV